MGSLVRGRQANRLSRMLAHVNNLGINTERLSNLLNAYAAGGAVNHGKGEVSLHSIALRKLKQEERETLKNWLSYLTDGTLQDEDDLLKLAEEADELPALYDTIGGSTADKIIYLVGEVADDLLAS